MAAFGRHRIKIHVANQWTFWCAIDAHIQHDCARLNHVARHKFGLTDSRHQNIRGF
jgi:hypothetical protein